MPSALHDIRKKLPSSCHILAVSKLQPVEKIRWLYDQGQTQFGENYAQEAKEKQLELADLKIDWHFIGRLQKNKVKDVVGHFRFIHSVDSLDLAIAIDKRAALQQVKQSTFIQLNLALEETKGGFSEKEFLQSWTELMSLKNVEIRGLMTMPPLEADETTLRNYFRKLREIRDNAQKSCASLTELSMGTSSDYQIAADEGATWVRLGTLLFGERPTR